MADGGVQSLLSAANRAARGAEQHRCLLEASAAIAWSAPERRADDQQRHDTLAKEMVTGAERAALADRRAPCAGKPGSAR